jgi:hypothetical protein
MSMFSATDNVKHENLAAGIVGPIVLSGGIYWIESISTGTGTINLQRVGPDGKTWTPRIREIATIKSEQTVTLPPGTYQWDVRGFTGTFLEITRMS